MNDDRRDRIGSRRRSAPNRRRTPILDVLEERVVLSGSGGGPVPGGGEVGTLSGPLAIDPAPFRNPVAGAGYQHQVSASGGTGSGYTFTATGLPAGLTMSGSGLVSGTVAAAATGTYTVAVDVVDDGGGTASQAFAVTVSPAIAAVPAAAVGSFYTHRIEAAGWTEGVTFSAVGLPAGLTITTAGLLSGTPTGTPGSAAVAISAIDAEGTRLTLGVTLVVNPAIVFDQDPGPREPAVGSLYGYQVAVSGGSGAGFVYEAAGLPQGLAIDPATGRIAGIPFAGQAGDHEVVVKATDDQKASASWAFTLTVNPAIALESGEIPSPAVGSQYDHQVAISGGSGSGYTFTATGLPTGLSISASGLISGVPFATGGPVSVFIAVTDGEGAGATSTLQLTINPALGIGSVGAAPQAAVGSPYSHRLTGTGGSGFGYEFAAVGLPPGLTIAADGLIAGTPTTRLGSPYRVTLTLTDGDGAVATRAFDLVVNPAMVLGGLALPDGVAGRAYSRSLTAAGGSGSGYTFAATGLPAGLAMSASGEILGTPTASAPQPSTVTIVLTDGGGASIVRTTSILVLPTFLLQGSIPGPSLDLPYASQFTATGGAGLPYTFSATGLPPGLTMDASGLISGTVTSGPGARYTVNVTVTDAVGWALTREYSVQVDPGVSVGVDVPPATVGAPYSHQVAATGGRGSGYTFTATGLPAGLAISPSGLISGILAAGTIGTHEVSVKVVDPVGANATGTFSLVVEAAVLPTATPENPYAATLAGSNGTVVGYTYAASGLPEGLAMTPDGSITGTAPPDAAGSYIVTVAVTAPGGVTTQVPYAMLVNPAIGLTVTAFPGTDFYEPYRLQLAATGGSGSGYTYAAVGLPDGVSLSPGGELIGRAVTSAGVPFSVVVTITDGDGSVAVRTYDLPVDSVPFATPGLVSLSLSSQAIEAGSKVTFTAVVTPPVGGAAATGWVLFFDETYDRNGDELLGSVAVVNGVAILSTSSLAAGTHHIYAVFLDSPEYGRSDSPRWKDPATGIESKGIGLVVTAAPTVVAPILAIEPQQATPVSGPAPPVAVQPQAPSTAAPAAATPPARPAAAVEPKRLAPDPAPAPRRVGGRLVARAQSALNRVRKVAVARPNLGAAARPMAAAARFAARFRGR